MVDFRKYYAVLSGEHRTLPLSELRAIISAEGIPYKEIANLDMVVVLEAAEDLPTYITRSALTKTFGEVLTVSESDAELTSIVGDVDWEAVIAGNTLYTINLIRIKEYSRWVTYDVLVNAVKPLISRKFVPHSKALKTGMPLTIVDFILSDGLIIVGRRQYRREFSTFNSRDPKNRPTYRPGTMKSVMARVLVNLSRVSVRREETYLDPFCGIGGLLIEACSIGLRHLGSDIDVKCVEDAKKNLNHFNCTPSVVVADACKLPYRYVDGVGTDPPYGRLTKSGGRKTIRELMECSINCLADIIRRRGYLVLAQSKDVELDEVLNNAGFKLVEKHYNWLHRSLVRNVYVAVRT